MSEQKEPLLDPKLFVEVLDFCDKHLSPQSEFDKKAALEIAGRGFGLDLPKLKQ